MSGKQRSAFNPGAQTSGICHSIVNNLEIQRHKTPPVGPTCFAVNTESWEAIISNAFLWYQNTRLIPNNAYKLLRQLIQKVLLLQKCLLCCYLRQNSECLTHFAWLLKNVQLLVVLYLARGSAVLCSGAQKSLVNISEVVALIMTFMRFILRGQPIYKVVQGKSSISCHTLSYSVTVRYQLHVSPFCT